MIDPTFYDVDDTVRGAKGLIFLGNKILIYRRDGNTNIHPFEIDLLGGGSEQGETSFETFRREIKEEFGLNIHRHQITYAKKYTSVLRSEEFGFFSVVKLNSEQARSITFGDEGIEYFLVDCKDYLSMDDAWKVFQNRTKDYLETVK